MQNPGIQLLHKLFNIFRNICKARDLSPSFGDITSRDGITLSRIQMRVKPPNIGRPNIDDDFVFDCWDYGTKVGRLDVLDKLVTKLATLCTIYRDKHGKNIGLYSGVS